LSRKAKDLESLLRLHSWTVDERRRELGVLLAREEELIQFGHELERQLIREQKIATEDPAVAGFIYASFAQNHRLRREQLERTLAALRGEIDQARDRLGDAYRQLKVYEEVQKARERKERAEAARKDQIAYDEIGETQFRQRQSREPSA
jgi:flagellar export protein FliJ